MRLLFRLLPFGLFSGLLVEALRTRRTVPRPPGPLRSSSREGERLTDWERAYLLCHFMRCPDCECGDLLTVRSDGCTKHVRCSLCPAKFHLIPLDNYVNGYRLPSFPLEAEGGDPVPASH